MLIQKPFSNVAGMSPNVPAKLDEIPNEVDLGVEIEETLELDIV